jgi:hypothetical protein
MIIVLPTEIFWPDCVRESRMRLDSDLLLHATITNMQEAISN